VDCDFIIKGIEAGKLEYRQRFIWGNPHIKILRRKILRRQLEEYIAAELGAEYLGKVTRKDELRK